MGCRGRGPCQGIGGTSGIDRIDPRKSPLYYTKSARRRSVCGGSQGAAAPCAGVRGCPPKTPLFTQDLILCIRENIQCQLNRRKTLLDSCRSEKSSASHCRRCRKMYGQG